MGEQPAPRVTEWMASSQMLVTWGGMLHGVVVITGVGGESIWDLGQERVTRLFRADMGAVKGLAIAPDQVCMQCALVHAGPSGIMVLSRRPDTLRTCLMQLMCSTMDYGQ